MRLGHVAVLALLGAAPQQARACKDSADDYEWLASPRGRVPTDALLRARVYGETFEDGVPAALLRAGGADLAVEVSGPPGEHWFTFRPLDPLPVGWLRVDQRSFHLEVVDARPASEVDLAHATLVRRVQHEGLWRCSGPERFPGVIVEVDLPAAPDDGLDGWTAEGAISGPDDRELGRVWLPLGDTARTVAASTDLTERLPANACVTVTMFDPTGAVVERGETTCEGLRGCDHGAGPTSWHAIVALGVAGCARRRLTPPRRASCRTTSARA